MGRQPTGAAIEGKMSEKTVRPAPSTKKTPSFADKHLTRTGSTKPERETPKPDLPSTTQPAVPPTGTRRQSSTRPAIEETKADAWEKAEMDKIKKRYETLNSSILSWENQKKTKAKRRMERTESELEQRRAKASQRYRSDMETINKTAGGAKAQAEENRRNQESKVKAKANKIRSTGKVSAKCFCF
ncbi:hypothetical protein L1049_005802 [Liquidambar formosana]|uniref:Remorin C-terminal domain-containing protein n=1 Tax=Liquidambar formosana TaxID=63359 RepID=A0AAP0RGH8_LIQFO